MTKYNVKPVLLLKILIFLGSQQICILYSLYIVNSLYFSVKWKHGQCLTQRCRVRQPQEEIQGRWKSHPSGKRVKWIFVNATNTCLEMNSSAMSNSMWARYSVSFILAKFDKRLFSQSQYLLKFFWKWNSVKYLSCSSNFNGDYLMGLDSLM